MQMRLGSVFSLTPLTNIGTEDVWKFMLGRKYFGKSVEEF
jgi:hypothetical protein